MSWRTVVITRRCKLDLNLNYLEIRAEEVKKIHLSELHTIIIESTAVSLTAALLCELMHRKIKVIFCDEKRNPGAELIPYYGTRDSTACIRQQVSWDENMKICAGFLNIKVLAIVGLHTVLREEDLIDLYKMASYEGISLLDIERYVPDHILPCERAYIVDSDNCEIYNDPDDIS